MQSFISPNFGPEKLESPTYEDLIDVFEDRMRSWFLLPASRLLEMPCCQIAAVALLITYFEGIEIYLSGKDSRNRSLEFFTNGFFKVFAIQDEGTESSKIVAGAIYNQARCGFVHDGMFRSRVFFSDVSLKPLFVSFPKKNGTLDFSQVESIVINPFLFYGSIRTHFEGYVKSLREGSDTAMRQAFETTVKLKWALDERGHAIGMTEEDFLGHNK